MVKKVTVCFLLLSPLFLCGQPNNSKASCLPGFPLLGIITQLKSALKLKKIKCQCEQCKKKSQAKPEQDLTSDYDSFFGDQ